ncbi:hypothetical protein BD309DRAFT_994083 [Dichomitus squalens]|uniref:Uncharacterized protein n=1 Tax=Dichomitus squalens TaxID=114155 RepID=A0A4Q9PA57_9APHY|nr:hypothetical protein BD309DRAFT_994083 [Dichomitus squalens]TBU51570.1 hypothetical protein BD310DRAFT_953200 [Dichomitus squalens]
MSDCDMVEIPLIWHQFLPEAAKDHEIACKKHEAALRKHDDAARKHESELQTLRTQVADSNIDPRQRTKLDKKIKDLVAKSPKPPSKPTPRMQDAEVPLMLSLAGALKLLLGGSTTEEQRQRGACLLFAYLQDFKRIYGVDAMVPNHHYATHIPAQLEEYGTVYEIWAFLAERLNKTLKSTNQNNQRGGQQEVTMMREFDRHMQVRAIVDHVSNLAPDGTLAVNVSRTITQRFLHESREARGTVEATGTASQDRERRVQDDACLSTLVGLGIQSARAFNLDIPLCNGVLDWYRQQQRNVPAGEQASLYHAHDRHAPSDPTARTLSYVVLNGRRITPKTSSGIVKVSLDGHPYLAGDVVRFFLHQQPGFSSPPIFAEMMWLVPQNIAQVANNPWHEL